MTHRESKRAPITSELWIVAQHYVAETRAFLHKRIALLGKKEGYLRQ